MISCKGILDKNLAIEIPHFFDSFSFYLQLHLQLLHLIFQLLDLVFEILSNFWLFFVLLVNDLCHF